MVTLTNVGVAVVVVWLLIIFIGRRREARVRIVSNPSNPDEIDLPLSTAVAREFDLLRETGKPTLRVVEAVDQEVDIPAATIAPVAAGSSIVASVASLVRRTYRLEIRYESDNPAELIAIVRLFSPLGRLLSSQLIEESSFLVLRANPGVLPPATPSGGSKESPAAGDMAAPDAKASTTPAAADAPSATADVHVQVALKPGAKADEPDAGATKKDEAAAAPKDDDLSRRKRRLGTAIGAWATYELLSLRRGPKPVLLTRDWKSYALFRFGFDWQARGSMEHARRAYREALGLDPFNTGALFNLAVLEENRGCHASALALMEAARAETERVARGVPGALVTNRMWYRIVYNLGAIHENARATQGVLPPGPPPTGCSIPELATGLQMASEDVEDMIRRAAKVIIAIERQRPSAQWARNQSLLTFLRTIQTAAVAMLLVMRGPSADPR